MTTTAIPAAPRLSAAAPSNFSVLRTMLAALITLLAIVGTLGLLLNVLFTQLYFAAPPSGDRAMGLVIPFFISAGAGIALTLAAILSAFRGGDSLLRLIPLSPPLAGLLAVIVAFGAVLCAFMAFICWCEPGPFHMRGSFLILVLGWLGGIAGPILLCIGLIAVSWMDARGVRSHPEVLRPLAVMLGALILLALTGYALGGTMFYQTLAQQAANRAAAIRQSLQQQASIIAEQAKPPAERLKGELDQMSPTTPLWPLVAYFPKSHQRFPLDAECRDLLISRILRVPNLDQDMLETAGSRYYIYRQGIADFLAAAPDALIGEHEKAWGDALLLSIQTAADAITCRPAWLSETFDSNPDPLDHIRSLLAASERFRSLPPHAPLSAALQSLTNSAATLNPDRKRAELLRALAAAGYTPAVPPQD